MRINPKALRKSHLIIPNSLNFRHSFYASRYRSKNNTKMQIIKITKIALISTSIRTGQNRVQQNLWLNLWPYWININLMIFYLLTTYLYLSTLFPDEVVCSASTTEKQKKNHLTGIQSTTKGHYYRNYRGKSIDLNSKRFWWSTSPFACHKINSYENRSK